MSTNEANITSVDANWLDRLVDGELSPDARRELLLRLEAEPGGWRRCALAFLEAQCWRETAASVARTARSRPVSAAQAASTTHPVGSALRWPLLSALAASLMGAFALGLAVARVSGFAGPASRGPTAALTQTAGLPPRMPKAAQPTEKILEALDREVKAVAVLDVGGPAAKKVQVPILSGPGLDERWLSDQPSAVPAYLAQQWERQGYKVITERKLYSVDLDGGGRLSIPIDEVKLRYVGHSLN